MIINSNLRKKYIKKANAYLVSWQEEKDGKLIDHRKWLTTKQEAQELFDNKQDEFKL